MSSVVDGVEPRALAGGPLCGPPGKPEQQLVVVADHV
jgi:hypothetical protein